MGGGSFSEASYNSSRATRAATKTPDFDYTTRATEVHKDLDPMRILKKPFGLLESRDSAEHPISTPVILTFDVTGSNYENAKIAQQKLPELMAKLALVCENPQVAIWANDDTHSIGKNALQLGEFESDNRIDDAIRNVWLTGHGGGNDGESYDLLIYAAARKTVTDSFEKRNKRGYMFLYADEPFFRETTANDIRNIFGDGAEKSIPIGELIAEAQQKWDIFVIWPRNGYKHAREQYEELFGADHVEDLQSPELLCEKVASIVSQREESYKENASIAVSDNQFTTRVV